MKIIGISDSHMHSLPKILEGKTADLLLIGGDWSFRGTKSECGVFKSDLNVIRPQFKDIVWITGNHELGCEDDPTICPEIAKETNTIYLENSEVILENGTRIWGSPITPYFGGWAWNYNRGNEIAEVWKNIPEGLDILLTHGPPFSCLDALPNSIRVGCEDLTIKLQSMDRPPKYMCFGHIHHSSGARIWKFPNGRQITCFNASICDEDYKPTNPPREFYL